jgi:hypothetical protein
MKIKLRRGLQFYVESYTEQLNEGEPVWMSDSHRLLFCDGVSSIRHDILYNNVTNLKKNNIYGNFNGVLGFHDLIRCETFNPESFVIPTNAYVSLGTAFSLIPSVDFANGSETTDYAYLVMIPSSFNQIDKDINFKMNYTLDDDTNVDKSIILNIKVLKVFNGEIPDIDSTSANDYTETIISSTNNIDKNAEFNFSSFMIPCLYDSESTRSDLEMVIIRISRDTTTDTFDGTFKLLNLKAYYVISGTEYGFHVGGLNSSVETLEIDRIHFPFASGNSIHCNDLDSGGDGMSSCNSSNYAYVMGGQDTTAGISDSISKFDFPFNSGNLISRGILSQNIVYGSSVNSSTYGYNSGGIVDTDLTKTSTIDRFLFAFDEIDAESVGNLSCSNYAHSSCNSSTHGYFFGGVLDKITTDRITYPLDSGTATVKGQIDLDVEYSAGFNSSSHGYCVGGGDDSVSSSVFRISFPFDSGNATNCGTISVAKQTSGCNSTTHGFIMGGENSGGTELSTIESLLFIFDPGSTSVVEGNLSSAKTRGTSCDGIDFATLFV